MVVAIGGSHGLIGTALRHSLEADGIEVRALSRTPSSLELTGVDTVVNLAGAGIGDARWTEDRKRQILESRTSTTELLATAICESDNRPRVLLSGSAIGFYGDTGDTAVDETAPVGEGFLSDVVAAWEAAAAPVAAAGIRTVLLRTSVVLSPDGGALAKQLPIFRLGLGGRFGSGRQFLSWITLADEVRAIRFLMEPGCDIAGPVNLATPHAVTNAEFTTALGRAVHRPTTITPMLGPRLLLGRELADALLLTSQRVEPAVLAAAGFSWQHPELDAALADLVG
jgi:uncharacterized protein (TIGR01777 family)